MGSSVSSLTKEQKIGFSLLLVFAFLSIGLGVLQIRNTMYGPLSLNNLPPVDAKSKVSTVDALRFRDTDYDGLNDFDELYVYGTSPYLFDTFSYGMSDKEVVAKGLPLCPKGQDCGTPIASGDSQVNGSSASTTAAALQAQLGTPPPDLIATLHDPAQLRQLLLESGLDKTVLQKVSDDQLMLLSNQILSDTSTLDKIRALERASALPRATATSTVRP